MSGRPPLSTGGPTVPHTQTLHERSNVPREVQPAIVKAPFPTNPARARLPTSQPGAKLRPPPTTTRPASGTRVDYQWLLNDGRTVSDAGGRDARPEAGKEGAGRTKRDSSGARWRELPAPGPCSTPRPRTPPWPAMGSPAYRRAAPARPDPEPLPVKARRGLLCTSPLLFPPTALVLHTSTKNTSLFTILAFFFLPSLIRSNYLCASRRNRLTLHSCLHPSFFFAPSSAHSLLFYILFPGCRQEPGGAGG